MNIKSFLILSAVACATVAPAQLRLTELMYDGADGEILEITNLGTSSIDLTGWSLDDNDGSDLTDAIRIDLSSLGTILPSESFVVTDEDDAATFRANWNLPGSVKVLAKVDPGFGRNDRVELYNNSNALQFRFAYGDQDFPGTFRSTGTSVNIPRESISLTTTDSNSVGTVTSVIGDSYGSYASSVTGNIGNPGRYAAPVPEPASLAALAIGAVAMLRRRKKG